MLPLNRDSAVGRVAGLRHFRVTTLYDTPRPRAVAAELVTDQFALDAADGVAQHMRDVAHRHPDVTGTMPITWTEIGDA